MDKSNEYIQKITILTQLLPVIGFNNLDYGSLVLKTGEELHRLYLDALMLILERESEMNYEKNV
jgi:hypothetical protein